MTELRGPEIMMKGRVAFVGNYLPRRCGIATFATDLCESVAAAFPEVSCIALPVNDGEAEYDYPSRVSFALRENDIASYRFAAEFLNRGDVDVVCLQHEYGIFGGRAGAHVLALLEALRVPVVTTLHTVLENPDPEQRRVLEAVARLSDRLVVMSEYGASLLRSVYRVSPEKIDLIPHGIPDMPFVDSGEKDPEDSKARIGVANKTVLLSFGLLSADKGIETVINALPAVLVGHPDVVYIVLGATHPHVKRRDGEAYRMSLHGIAAANGVDGNVVFHDRFVDTAELIRFIAAADIYLTPYLKAEQITSGTLAYTVGAGKAVVSTPYGYAREILADGRGALVPFGDPAALAAEVVSLLDDAPRCREMRRRAYRFGRDMIWPTVARRYMESFACAARASAASGASDRDEGRTDGFPPLRLDHLYRMTDDTGMFQHALFTLPNPDEGYTTDDNARALITSVLLGEAEEEGMASLSARYLSFVLNALDHDTGRFRNFMDRDRKWLEAQGSDDSQGRALWALGILLGRAAPTSAHAAASDAFRRGLPALLKMGSPRAWAFALIGLHEYLRRFADDDAARHARDELAKRLLALHRASRSETWPWCEDSVTYCNAALPQALLLGGEGMGDPEMIRAGLESLAWLARLHGADADPGHFVPVGSNGFYTRRGLRARYDQQPVEAHAAVSACLEAYRITGDELWREEAHRAFAWFLGGNDLSLSLYDPVTGGCRDGLHADRLNENQGAESSLAFLQSLLEMRHAERATASPEKSHP